MFAYCFYWFAKLHVSIISGFSVMVESIHFVKSVFIRSFSGPYFPTFRLNTLHVSIFSLNAEKYRLEKAPNTDTFKAVIIESGFNLANDKFWKCITSVLLFQFTSNFYQIFYSLLGLSMEWVYWVYLWGEGGCYFKTSKEIQF